MVLLALASPGVAQVADHLQCYKVKDTSLVLKGTLDLENLLSGHLTGCKVSSAKMYCTATTKSAVNVVNITTPITPLGYSGQPVTEDRICYKVACPKPVPPEADQVVTDQFLASHNITKLKTAMLCTPAIVGSAYCGNGTIEGDEQCDVGPPADLGGATCVTLGYGSGTLACGAGCRYDVTGCVAGAFPASGQTACYNSGGASVACAGTGQDGETQAGADLTYVDNGDGTITDQNTGLMWEKQSDDGSAHDRDTFLTWANAPSHITTLNTTSFAGYTDWRMPNMRELSSLVNYGAASPAITTSAFHTNCFGGCTVTQCSCTAFNFYWSSTTLTNLTTATFAVNFTDGTVNVFTKSSGFTAAVRGVRGGPQ